MAPNLDISPAHQLLKTRFGLSEFRKGQLGIIESVLKGGDTMAVMPTGGGKSLCYQLPAVLFDQLVVVISPLIALMEDQVRLLAEKSIPSGCLHSGQSDVEKRQVFGAIRKGGCFVLYLSPERVQKPGFADWIKSQDVGLFAVDEAHCVSQWGHDFRPDYAKLAMIRDLKPDVPVLALTATATPTVLEDIIHQLRLRQPERHIHGFYRPNLFYQVSVIDQEDEKIEMIKEAIRKTRDGRVLVYCGTRQSTEDISSQLTREFEHVGFYHAGLSSEERGDIQRKLESRNLRILCATNAFGMGIDYPDVRLVIHFQMPANIESFYQEMGRAGRDGQTSRCLLLYSKKDKGLQSFFIQQSKAEPRIISAKWRALDAIVQFSEGGECRHSGILTYFRDSERIQRCGHCDACEPKSDWVVVKPTILRRVVTQLRKKSRTVDLTKEFESPESEVRAAVLKDWRKSYADENDVPAFIVFSNRTMIDLANKNPKTKLELQRVYGFGPAKVETLGEQILACLRNCD